jgi:glutaconate CoA-transferase subunit B
LLRFEPDTKEMVLVSVHPGVEVETVVENTGWPLKVTTDLTSTPAPTKSELEILARFDPNKYWTRD